MLPLRSSRALVLVLAALAGCARARLDPPAPPEAASAPEAPPPPAHAFVPIARDTESRAGSAVVLGTLGGKRVVFVADQDAGAVRAVDRDARAELASTKLGGTPSELAIGGDGRLYAALRDRDAIAVLEAERPDAPLVEAARISTAPEPVGLAITPDDEALLVTSGWGRTLAAYTMTTRAQRFAVALPREPRGVTISEDGKQAFVAHMVGSTISTVALDEGHAVSAIALKANDIGMTFDCMSESIVTHKRFSVQGFAIARFGGKILAPAVVARPEPSISSGGYGSDQDMFLPEEPSVAAIDAASGKGVVRMGEAVTSIGKGHTKENDFNPPGLRASADPCLLPRAAAVDSARSSLLVACLGSDRVVEIGAEDAPLSRAELGRWKVASGPLGIAIDGEAREAIVFSQFDRELAVLKLGDARVPPAKPAPASVRKKPLLAPAYTIALSRDDGPDESIALGRKLFHAVGDKRISSDGRVCASCHPDGRDDGLVWSSPEGRLQTPMLAGRLEGTGPYGWSGHAKTVEGHLVDTFKRLGGKGLKGADLTAIVAYATSLPTPARAAEKSDPRVARGREVFESAEAMCSLCHTEAKGFTDGSPHEVGSGATLDTPSLRFVAGTAPYFHDGRYATLRDLLKGSDGKMGQTHHLPEADLAALEAYLGTL